MIFTQLKKYFTISNILHLGSMLFAIGVLLKVAVERYQLPAGACPVDNNRLLLYIALILVIGVYLGTYFYSYLKKKQDT